MRPCRTRRRSRCRWDERASDVRSAVSEMSGSIVADLEAEQRGLLEVVAGIDEDAWLTPTPAWGWDVRDTISHLADTDELAIDTMRDGPRALSKVSGAAASSADVTYQGVLRGRRMSGAEVGRWWSET